MKDLLIPILLLLLCACGNSQHKKQPEPLQVGDIYFDKEQDDTDFTPCDDTVVYQYYNFGKGLQYKGEKSAINKFFAERLVRDGSPDDSGFITIRFVVNCKGKTGWLRSEGMNDNYESKNFSEHLVSDLKQLIYEMDGWIVPSHEGQTFDYYQYLTFKFDHGKLIEIMP